MNYKLVIFDFDGTLADSFPWFQSVFEELAAKYGLPPMDQGSLEKLRTLDIHQILKEYKIPPWKLLLIGNHLKKLMSEQIDRISMVSGMQSVVDELHARGVKLAIVTSNAGRNVRRVLGPQLMERFDYVESGVSMFGKKGKFQKIIKKAGVLPRETLCIGDEVRDLESSRASQIPFGAVSWGYTDVKTLQRFAPDEVFEHPAQILASFG